VLRVAFLLSGKEISMGQVEQWQILAEEAIQEQDPEKLLEIIEALTRALDDRELQKSQANAQRGVG
jgi:hypothetical protein